MKPLHILAGVRTPFLKVGAGPGPFSTADLGVHVTKALLLRTKIDPAIIDEVIFGCVGQPAESANIARVIALRAGLPQWIPAATVHRNCASGLEALTTAFERVQAGRAGVLLVGGVEAMSHLPLLFSARAARKFGELARARGPLAKLRALTSFRPANFLPQPALTLGLTDPTIGLSMGQTAEQLACDYHITRAAQDAYAAASHQKAAAARGWLREEIVPLMPNGTLVDSDTGVRADSTPEALARLRPVFDPVCGTVTAGNSSQISDGAVALLVASEEKAAELGLTPLGRLERYAYAGCDPRRMGLGPVHAVRKTGRALTDADVIELNEAFAAQVLAVEKEFGDLPREKLNPHGGAIALGHPVGASGARLVLTCLRTLHERGARTGLVTLCVGGGQGGALWLERD